MLWYVISILVVIGSINAFDEMYNYLRVRESMKLLFFVNIMNGDDTATPEWPQDGKLTKDTADVVATFTPKPPGIDWTKAIKKLDKPEEDEV